MMNRAKYFATHEELRLWLDEFHLVENELWVGFYKKSSGKPSITWPQAVDALLCFGWIDGIRKSVDEAQYVIRVTPRKSKSTWSAINIRRVDELAKLGLMRAAGWKAFEARTDERSAIYAYEQRKSAKLSPPFDRRFRANKKAWEFFRAQAPSYQRTALYWVTSAKQEKTRDARLERLIRDSERGKRRDGVIPSRKKK